MKENWQWTMILGEKHPFGNGKVSKLFGILRTKNSTKVISKKSDHIFHPSKVQISLRLSSISDWWVIKWCFTLKNTLSLTLPGTQPKCLMCCTKQLNPHGKVGGGRRKYF